MNNDIIVSIICTVYNHERFLRKCLDGFIMQKTNFKFEVLIHDDASTDNSAQIIKEFEKLYPQIIKPIYQKENQYSKCIPFNWKYNIPRALGKYIAICEGDDFWTDDHKLQSQYDILEAHPDVIMSVHRVCVVNENGEPTDQLMPTKEQFDNERIMTRDEWIDLQLEYAWYFQTSCFFFRKDAIDNIIDKNIRTENWIDKRPEFMRIAPTGDEPLMLFLCQKGGLAYINREMSSYRIGSVGSWTTSMRNKEKRIKMLQSRISMFKLYDAYTNYKYSDKINYLCLRNEFRILDLQKRFKELLKPQYKQFLKEYNKNILKLYIYAYFPKLYGIISRLRSRFSLHK